MSYYIKNCVKKCFCRFNGSKYIFISILYLFGILSLKFDILIYDGNECHSDNKNITMCDLSEERSEKCVYVSHMDVCMDNDRFYLSEEKNEKCVYVSDMDVCMDNHRFKEYLGDKNILLENILVINIEYPSKRLVELELFEKNNTNVLIFIGRIQKTDLQIFKSVLQEEMLDNSWEKLSGEDFFKIMNFLRIFKVKNSKKNCKFIEEIAYTFMHAKYNNYFGSLLLSSDFGTYKIDNWLLIGIFNSVYKLFYIEKYYSTKIFSNLSEDNDTLSISDTESDKNSIELFIDKNLFKFISGEYNGLKISYFILFIFKSIKISTCTILKDISQGLSNYYKFAIYFPENIESLFFNTKYFYTEFLDFCTKFSFCKNVTKIHVRSEYFTDEICNILRKFLGLQKLIFNIKYMRYIDIDPIIFFGIYKKLIYLEIKCVRIVDPVFPLSKIILTGNFKFVFQCQEFIILEDCNFTKKKKILKHILSNLNISVMRFSLNDLVSSIKEFSNLNKLRVKNYGRLIFCAISAETVVVLKKMIEINLSGFYICSDFFKCCKESHNIIEIRLISCLIEFVENNLELSKHINESLNTFVTQNTRITDFRSFLQNIRKFKNLFRLEFNKCEFLNKQFAPSHNYIDISYLQSINPQNNNPPNCLSSIKELKILCTCLSLEYLNTNLNLIFLSKICFEMIDLSLEDIKILNRLRFLKNIILIKINLKNDNSKDLNELIFVPNTILDLNEIILKSIVLTNQDIYCISKMKYLKHLSFENINFRKYNISLRNINPRVLKSLKNFLIIKCDMRNKEYWCLFEEFSDKIIHFYR